MAKFFSRLSKAAQKNKPGSTDVPASTATLGIGSLINGHYRLDAELGRGGMGIVYRAHDIPNDRDVAVKVINLNEANALSLHQFLKESAIISKLTHPHIVAVYETGIIESGAGESSPFIVMELVQGKSLSETGRFTFANIIEIGKQVCDALGYVHEQGYVYRDLKPGNVFLEKQGFHYFIKLLDFGLARPRGEAYLSVESTMAGTTFYLAPELISGQPADTASDLYALGATLYEMITGRVPFFDIDEQNILSQHLNESVPPPSHSRSDVPPALESIVLRLLEKKPEDRYASAKEVQDALSHITLTSDSAVRGNLPSVDFKGNKDDIEKMTQLLATSQLVTLLSNDDSLALAVGGALTDEFTDGVWFVDLSSVGEPGLVLKRVASTLGVTENPNRPLAVSTVETLREKKLLLLLTHCDHVLSACAHLVDAIASGCSDVRILSVSRQPLNLSLEKCYQQD